MGAQISPRAWDDTTRLQDLAGMDRARSWGEALAVDLADYKQQRISWRDVDPGLLLYGPPGTGKTIFVRALAQTCRVPLIATSYAHWQRAGVGRLADLLQEMREDFDKAFERAPSILFIDEIDAVPARDLLSSMYRDRWGAVLAALCEHLDGINSREGVVAIGACIDVSRLDPALIRSGRLDRAIPIDMPSPSDLEGILRYHLGGELRGETLQTLCLAALGRTGADIERLVRDARRHARQETRAMTLDDLLAVCVKPSANYGPGNEPLR